MYQIQGILKTGSTKPYSCHIWPPKFRWWRINIDKKNWQVCIPKIVDHIKIIRTTLETDDSTTHRINRPWNLRISLLVFSLTTSSSFNGGDATSFSLRISNPGIWEHAQDMFLRQWKWVGLTGPILFDLAIFYIATVLSTSYGQDCMHVPLPFALRISALNAISSCCLSTFIVSLRVSPSATTSSHLVFPSEKSTKTKQSDFRLYTRIDWESTINMVRLEMAAKPQCMFFGWKVLLFWWLTAKPFNVILAQWDRGSTSPEFMWVLEIHSFGM